MCLSSEKIKVNEALILVSTPSNSSKCNTTQTNLKQKLWCYQNLWLTVIKELFKINHFSLKLKLGTNGV